MPTPEEILDRVIKKIFAQHPKSDYGVTKMGPHVLPKIDRHGQKHFGRVCFEVGSLMVHVAHKHLAYFNVIIIGVNGNHRSYELGNELIPFDDLHDRVYLMVVKAVEQSRKNAEPTL